MAGERASIAVSVLVTLLSVGMGWYSWPAWLPVCENQREVNSGGNRMRGNVARLGGFNRDIWDGVGLSHLQNAL